jgi:predicted AlkP superfamily phosphohydrolase/phosphomutase
MKRTLLLAAVLALAAGVAACHRGSGKDRVIVLGLDGLDPRAVDLLMSEGKMPNFARLRQEGAYGRLLSAKPLLSPVVWTTIATGKTPDQHGIGHFVAIDDKTGEQLPVTSQMRKVKALWNILSDKGRKVAVVGYWATWPAETVNGEVVSDHTCYHFLFPQGQTGDASSRGDTYPPELLARIAPLVRRPGDVTYDEASRFIHVDRAEFDQPFEFTHDVSHFRWALATADSYRKIGVKLFQDDKPDLLLTYIEGTDSVAHLFGHLFRAPALSGELAEQQRKFGQAVEQMYLYADGIVGDFLKAADADTTLLVVSDHGFDLGAIQDDPSKTRDMRRVSERFHNVEGVIYMWGRHVKRGRLDQPKITDVAPTVLALAALRTSLAGALGALGRYPDAMKQLEVAIQLDPLDVEAYHNKAVIFERLGQKDAAIAQYRLAVRYNPQYEPSRRALERLTGSAELRAPRTDTQKKAMALAEAAAQSARKGDYATAMKQLDEAEKADPRSVLVQQYRSNVAYLEGDVPAAVKALEKALALEPDNALFKSNLARLRAQAAARAK